MGGSGPRAGGGVGDLSCSRVQYEMCTYHTCLYCSMKAKTACWCCGCSWCAAEEMGEHTILTQLPSARRPNDIRIHFTKRDLPDFLLKENLQHPFRYMYRR